jgi:hypothetical protein
MLIDLNTALGLLHGLNLYGFALKIMEECDSEEAHEAKSSPDPHKYG